MLNRSRVPKSGTVSVNVHSNRSDLITGAYDDILCDINAFVNNARFYLLTFDDRKMGPLIEFLNNYK